MTIQEAADQLLREEGQPLKSREIAKLALDRGLVYSNAKNPVFSHASTIEKNIRDEIYNRPKLVFIHTQAGRVIGLPEWSNETESSLPLSESPAVISPVRTKNMSLKLPTNLYEKIELAAHAKIADTLEDTIILILKKGLSELTPAIKEGLTSQLRKLEDI
ncbi:MAG: HTH domain-containing protein [Thermodesulfobacteriota bacterium]